MSKWRLVKLEDVCDILDNMRVPITASEREKGQYPYYGANGVQDYVAGYIFDDDLVLLAEDGGNFGSKDRPIAYRVSGKCWVNNHAHVLKPGNGLDVDYLCYSIMFYDVSKLISGTTRAKLNQSAVRKMVIPLPPIEVQKQIAKTLDVALKLLALRKKQLAELDNLIKATFYNMFGDPVLNDKGWSLKPLSQLVAKTRNSLKRGPFGGALKKEIFVNEGYLVYEQYHALNNDYSFKRYFIDQSTFNKLKEFEVKSGDILISCSGVYLGKLSIVPTGGLPGIINQALLKVTLDENEMNPIFFVNVFSNSAFRNKYIASNRGSGIPNMPPMSSMKNIDFITPSIQIQNKFAQIVTKIDEQKALVQKAIDESQYLFDSLMSQYFE